VVAATDIDHPRIGVDGCGIPVHGMPLRAMATMFARFGSPERMGRLASATDRVVRGMLARPHLVGGTRRLDTDVMTAGAGSLVAKEGAEGLVCATSLSQGVGIALKIRDGNWRRLAPAFVRVLRDLDILPATVIEELSHHVKLPVLGGEEPQGTVEAVVRLRRNR
jgi:L-asparaginase II